jgi:small subunit ribosomal protein S13
MAEEKQVSKRPIEPEPETLVRIMGFDVPGGKHLYVGLTKIKGISWAISNAICVKLKLDKKKKIGDLSKEDIKKIEDFLKDLDVPKYLKNRRYDLETGENRHLFGNDLDMRKDFDIKRLMKMKSYKGVRHSSKLPVRGQRTRANFRSRANKRTVGVKRKKK